MCVVLGCQQRPDGIANLRGEVADNYSDALFLDPFRVIALMRHGPGVALYDDRQPLRQRFADRARPGFADEEIGQIHERRDFPREPHDQHGNPLFDGP